MDPGSTQRERSEDRLPIAAGSSNHTDDVLKQEDVKRRKLSSSDSGAEKTKRATQACLLCRKRKLRCLGGWPCKRCADSHSVCDFGQGAADRSNVVGDGRKAYARLEQLESSVANLLAGLSGPETTRLWAGEQSLAANSSTSEHAYAPSDAVRFDPNVLHWSPDVSHQASTPSVVPPSSTEATTHITSKERAKGKGQKAEERLAVATEGVFEPPFKALVFHPSVWDNREASRRNSPERTLPPSRDEPTVAGAYDRRYGRDRDDPLSTGIVNTATAEMLFKFFIDHCHPFLPIIDVTLDDPFRTICTSPPLISAVCAIAARFYNRFCPTSPLDPATPMRLANLAMFHLGQTLLRKQHTLNDVQTILLLAAWCLMGEGGGPDSWVMSGHAVRVLRRLGVHRVLAKAEEAGAKPGTDEWTALEKTMPQWRTWLCWLGFDGLFSLGFGRPQSTHVENLDESVLLRIRLNQPLPRPGSTRSVALHGDLYLVGQVQLTHIGRDLRSWVEQVAERQHDEEQLVTFKELNQRLDEWSRLWVWSSSPHAIFLGTSVTLSRLQGEHMRLCLNSYALRYKADEDEFIADCLKQAFNAAVSIIQVHFDSSQSNFAMSFATDYMIITVAQAALFLIRMTRAPVTVQNVVSLDSGVITHYLHMAVQSLEMGDLSETRLATFLARTIREIASVAGLGDQTSEPVSASVDPGSQGSILPDNEFAQGLNTDLGFMFDGESRFDIDNFLQLEAYSELGYLLGLPAEGTGPM